jgi:hypothetical protein
VVGVRSSWCPKAKLQIHGDPTGAALAWKMRPTTALPSSTSKSSSFHSPDGREAGAHYRGITRQCVLTSVPFPTGLLF